MHKWLGCAVLLFPWTLPSVRAQKDPAEEVVVKMLGELEKLAETLAGIKDEAGATSARDDLKKTVQTYLELRALAEKLPPPPREVKDRLAKEYKKKFVDVQEKVIKDVARVRATIPGGRDALAEVSALLLGKEFKAKEKEKDKEKDGK